MAAGAGERWCGDLGPHETGRRGDKRLWLELKRGNVCRRRKPLAGVRVLQTSEGCDVARAVPRELGNFSCVMTGSGALDAQNQRGMRGHGIAAVATR